MCIISTYINLKSHHISSSHCIYHSSNIQNRFIKQNFIYLALVTMKQKAEYKILMAAMLLFYIDENVTLAKAICSSNTHHHTEFQILC
jgi:hypothetical protein